MGCENKNRELTEREKLALDVKMAKSSVEWSNKNHRENKERLAKAEAALVAHDASGEVTA